MSQFIQWLISITLLAGVALLTVIAYSFYGIYRVLRCWWNEIEENADFEDNDAPMSILESIHRGLELKYGRKK